MADLSDTQAALNTKIVGSDATGVETNQVHADTDGNLNVIDPTDGPVVPGTVALKSSLQGGQHNTVLPVLTNTQQSALQTDPNGKLITAMIPWQHSSNASLDAFKRFRTSDTFPLWDAKCIYDMQPLSIDNILLVGATATFLPNEASTQLSVTTTIGSKATRRSRQWIKYHPGSSQLIKCTGLLGAPKAGVSQRIGYYDNSNGIFFEQTIAGLSVVRRTFTSGVVVDNVVAQASWNLDRLDGTGPSGKTVTDASLSLIYVMDFEWLSYGRIRWGIDFGDTVVYVHEFSGVNTLTVPVFTTPDLPITWEIENTTATASVTSMKAVCASVHSEGGQESSGFKFSATNGVGTVGVTTRVPVLTIRPKLLFAGQTNRATIWPLSSAAINIATGDCFLEVIRNGTLTGTPVWNSGGVNSAVEYDFAATGITGGDIIDTFAIAGGAFTPMDNDSKLALTLSADGTVQDTFTIVCTKLAGTITLKTFIDWKEWR